jgi:hypothetical protein
MLIIPLGLFIVPSLTTITTIIIIEYFKEGQYKLADYLFYN